MYRALLAAGVFVSLVPSIAEAGTVTAVKFLGVSSNAVPLGVPVTIRVEGTNPCGAVTLSYGDGQLETKTLDGATGLPFTVTHTYIAPSVVAGGSYTLSAKGESDCRSGPVTLTFTIAGRNPGGGGTRGGGHDQDQAPGTGFPGRGGPDAVHPGGADPLILLCAQMKCEEMLGDPVIDGGVGKVSQNSFIFVTGKRFWLGAGQLQLHIGGSSPAIFKLGNLEWNNTAIGGTIPDFGGLKDQPAHIQVIRADGKKSNLWPVSFRAAQDVIKLTDKDRSMIKPILCSDESDSDRCNDHQDTNVALSILTCRWDPDLTSYTSAFIHGSHETGWDPLGGDAGTDHYFATLKNGWTFFDLKGSRHPDKPGWANIALSGIGTPTMGANVKWKTGGSSECISYKVSASAIGPRGVPYK